ncbi:inositol monophosphatase [Euhalothece natronophila Z-M001]|uniref:Inositol monophosphatase n=1 Tax=Euhalothece natronophila Z-M001 TaxID=522448 RepID=A0A5B8NKW8_9CHRO|nr:inositol monophosphatase family protein [Euhalothece natronophila]QDZ39724.1 inositol monophosphatase [Euhalothece natronophila Z-M001]
MEQFWSSVLAFSEEVTQQVGAILSQQFGKVQATNKPDGSLLTESDQWADEQIRSAIAQKFPDHGVLTEETVHIFPDTEWCWVIDPIDGTTNFTRGIPVWGISMGLLYQGEPVFGYVHFPILQQSFHGFWLENSGLEGENGAYCNGQPIHSSPDDLSTNHLFSLCVRSADILGQPFPCKTRIVGVCTYSFLLVGIGAALGAVEAIPKVWDLAAVWAIVQGAGGKFVSLTPTSPFPLQPGEDYGKKPLPTLVLSRSELASTFEPLVQSVAKSSNSPNLSY